jgi:hypothetical protein
MRKNREQSLKKSLNGNLCTKLFHTKINKQGKKSVAPDRHSSRGGRRREPRGLWAARRFAWTWRRYRLPLRAKAKGARDRERESLTG